jgi:hypothetical protein
MKRHLQGIVLLPEGLEPDEHLSRVRGCKKIVLSWRKKRRGFVIINLEM